MRISDWSSDVCSSDLVRFRSIGLFVLTIPAFAGAATPWRKDPMHRTDVIAIGELAARTGVAVSAIRFYEAKGLIASLRSSGGQRRFLRADIRSEEHTSELQSLMRTSYAVFCLKKKKHNN